MTYTLSTTATESIDIDDYVDHIESSVNPLDRDSVIGHDGERVELTYLETTTLDRGKVMFYRASEDIHSQYHPAEFSVSVNLLIDNPEQRHRPQFIFDVENGTIASIAPTPAILGPQVVCELAGFVGDATTVNLLEDLAEYHERPRLRVAAYEALEALTPDRKAEFTRRALADRDEYVRHVSRSRQVKLENP
jgi:hypothetical protein